MLCAGVSERGRAGRHFVDSAAMMLFVAQQLVVLGLVLYPSLQPTELLSPPNVTQGVAEPLAAGNLTVSVSIEEKHEAEGAPRLLNAAHLIAFERLLMHLADRHSPS